MIATYVGMFAGLVVGLAMAGPSGAVIGTIVGMALGLLWTGAADARRQAAAGVELVRERQPILCVPKGSVADVTFVRDAAKGEWLDVERCTLCSPEDEVQCQKRCLVLIRDALPRRKHAVHATT